VNRPIRLLLTAITLCPTLHAQTTAPSTQPVRLKWIGVYTQPIESFDKWAAYGTNLLVHSELKNGTVSQAAWRAAARARGFVYLDTYLSDDDADDPNLLGWILKDSDEWNRARGNPATRPAVRPMIEEAQRLRALNAARGTSKWIFANADGPGVTVALWERPPYNGVRNNEKALLPHLTARSMDWYPRVFTTSTQPTDLARRPLYLPAQAVWRLRTWSDELSAPPAAYVAIVEAARGHKSPLGITGDEMRETVDYLTGQRPFPVPDANARPVMTHLPPIDALIFWTANGQSGPGWRWDATNDDQRLALIDITTRLKTQPPPPPATQPSELDTLRAKLAATEAERDAARADAATKAAERDAARARIQKAIEALNQQ
jgi:hypothetical protein